MGRNGADPRSEIGSWDQVGGGEAAACLLRRLLPAESGDDGFAGLGRHGEVDGVVVVGFGDECEGDACVGVEQSLLVTEVVTERRGGDVGTVTDRRRRHLAIG